MELELKELPIQIEKRKNIVNNIKIYLIYYIDYQLYKYVLMALTGTLVIYLSPPVRVIYVLPSACRGSISFYQHYRGTSPIGTPRSSRG